MVFSLLLPILLAGTSENEQKCHFLDRNFRLIWACIAHMYIENNREINGHTIVQSV